jgi:hypothetical protein
MTADKTRVIPRKQADPTAAQSPRLVGGQIVFLCPAGHRIVVPVALAGKHGTCSKCSVPLRIPETAELAAVEPVTQPAGAETPAPAAGIEPVAQSAAAPPPAPANAESDWNFIAADGQVGGNRDHADWSLGEDLAGGSGEINPMARMLARLWAERDHGGVIELHLAGGAVILPEEFSARWSGASHGLFASQAADGSVTLTAVAWDTVQRIVVRQLAAVPGDMFE